MYANLKIKEPNRFPDTLRFLLYNVHEDISHDTRLALPFIISQKLPTFSLKTSYIMTTTPLSFKGLSLILGISLLIKTKYQNFLPPKTKDSRRKHLPAPFQLWLVLVEKPKALWSSVGLYVIRQSKQLLEGRLPWHSSQQNHEQGHE